MHSDVVEDSTTPLLLQDKISSIRHLEKNSPETLALARDWEDMAWSLTKCRNKIDKYALFRPPLDVLSYISIRLQAEEHDTLSLGMLHLHYREQSMFCLPKI